MKKISLFLIVLICCGLSVFAQNKSYRDVVYLKNGSVVKGTITEQIPNQSLKMETSDGSIFVYQMSEVDKITKEEITSSNNNKNFNKNGIRTTARSYRSPSGAGWLSFLIPGVGQFYNGQVGKGAGFLAAYLTSASLMYYGIDLSYSAYEGDNEWEMLTLFGSVSVIICWVWSMVDANHSAKEINETYGFASINLSSKVNLAFSPEVRPIYMPAINNIVPTYGAGIKLSF